MLFGLILALAVLSDRFTPQETSASPLEPASTTPVPSTSPPATPAVPTAATPEPVPEPEPEPAPTSGSGSGSGAGSGSGTGSSAPAAPTPTSPPPPEPEAPGPTPPTVSAPLTPRIVVPGTPRSVSAHPGPGPAQVTLNWAPPASDGGAAILAYEIWRGLALDRLDMGIQVPCCSFIDQAPESAVTYFYTIAAVNVAGTGPSVATYSMSFPDVPPSEPVPELGSLVLVAAGLVVAGLVTVRRR